MDPLCLRTVCWGRKGKQRLRSISSPLLVYRILAHLHFWAELLLETLGIAAGPLWVQSSQGADMVVSPYQSTLPMGAPLIMVGGQPGC